MFDLAGKTLGKYRLVEKLGQGGMAQVYRAYQPDLDRYVAVKVLHPHLTGDPEFETRFRREARAVAALEHPAIVRVYDFAADQGLAFLVMECVAGVSLRERLRGLAGSGQYLPLPQVLRLAAALADALDYAHLRGVIHRDLKPANVLLTPAGRPVLADFGIARMFDATVVTESGGTLGTPAYMSPEQGRGEPGDARSDIYALGIILYQLCVGHVPFDADTPYAIILKHITAPLPPPRAARPDLPEALERIILKALAKEPGDRFQSAGELGRALRAVPGGQGDAAGEGEGDDDGSRSPRAAVPDEAERAAPAPPPPAPGGVFPRRVALGAALLAGLVLAGLALAVALGWVALPGRTFQTVVTDGEHGVLVLQGPELAADTWLDPDTPDQAWHDADLVHLQGPLTPDRLLLRFELPPLPDGARLISATLVARTELWGEQPYPGAAVAYRLLVPWQAPEATYNRPWSEPGLAAGWDYDATPLAVAPVPDAGLLVLDVTPAVAGWLEGRWPNYGLLLMMSADSHNQVHHWIYMSEQPDTADRPALRVAYEVAR